MRLLVEELVKIKNEISGLPIFYDDQKLPHVPGYEHFSFIIPLFTQLILIRF